MRGTIFLVLLGFASASQLKHLKVQHPESKPEKTEDLTVKMPDAIVAEVKLMEQQEAELRQQEAELMRKPATALVEERTQLSLSQKVEDKKIMSSQSTMLESGVVHSNLKPIVQAKVMKVMSFIQENKAEYEEGSRLKKKEIQRAAEDLIMENSGTRSFNKELCNELWGQSSEVSSVLSSVYCPSLISPPSTIDGAPPLKTLQLEPPSRVRSAFLAQYFWNSLLSKKTDEVIDMLADDSCYYTGHHKVAGKDKNDGLCGKQEVKKTLPYIGFPSDSKLSNPTEWHCDSTSCITPIRAWAKHSNRCLITWNDKGKASEVIVPLDLWG